MNDAEDLRRMSANDTDFLESFALTARGTLDAKTLALVRLGALVAIGAPDASLRVQVDDAVSAGAKDSEIIAILAGISSIVGWPRVVAAAPKLIVAMGYESDLPSVED